MGAEQLAFGHTAAAPQDLLRKLHVEITTRCNLDCSMCQRHVWDEPNADMAPETFDTIVHAFAEFPGGKTLQLGGFGEPLSHPQIVDFVRAAAEAGLGAEIVTNGALLSRELGMALIGAGLQKLVLSVGCSEEIVEQSVPNLRRLHRSALGTDGRWPEVALHAVLKRSNVPTLRKLRSLAMVVHAGTISVSHLLPYSREMAAEALYGARLPAAGTSPQAEGNPWRPHVMLPALEWSGEEARAVGALLAGQPEITLGRTRVDMGTSACPFVMEGRAAIDWRGNLAPCLPLLRTHPVVTPRRSRTVKQWHVGNVCESSLRELWSRPEYVAFRERVREFAFPPCPNCGDCELVVTNEADCYGNPFPTCGDCLYGRGLVRCP
ncbi:MAG: radical SAM protein [Armatimonadetes bacterium]|nr:radical SAM protein [Armatimonadota bacterium]